jgi:hypothetical protein
MVGMGYAFAVVELVKIAYLKRLGEHCLERIRETVSGAPREVVAVVLAFHPLREPSDMVWVALISNYADDFAAVVVEAFAKDAEKQSRNVVAAIRFGVKFGEDGGAHSAP